MRKLFTFILTFAALAVFAQTPPSGTKQASTDQMYIAPNGDLYNRLAAAGISAYYTRQINRVDLDKKQNLFYLDIRDFGGVANAANNTQAIKNVIQSAGQLGAGVYFPNGVWRTDSILHITGKQVKWLGQSKDSTFIEAIGSTRERFKSVDTFANIRVYAMLMSDSGTDTLLGNSASTISTGQNFLKVVSGLNLVKGDLIKLTDTTSFSYSSFRATYREGEFFKVVAYRSDTIFVDHGVSASYPTITSAEIYKCNYNQFSLQDISFRGLPFPNFYAVRIKKTNSGRVKNVGVYGAGNVNMDINDGYDFTADNLTSIQDVGIILGAQTSSYALSLTGIQNFEVKNSVLNGFRHGITTNVSSLGKLVVNRFGLIQNCTLTSDTLTAGADLHGTSEYITFDNCTVDAFALSGAKNKFINGYINPNKNKVAYLGGVSEVKEFDFEISGNFFNINDSNTATSANLIQYRENGTSTVGANGGNFVIKNNTFKMQSTNPALYPVILFQKLDTKVWTKKVNLDFSDNIFDNNSTRAAYIGISDAVKGKNINVIVKNNRAEKMSLSTNGAKSVIVKDNEIYRAYDNSIVSTNDSLVLVEGNTISGYVTTPGTLSNVYKSAAIAVMTAKKVILNDNKISDPGRLAQYSYYLSGIDTLAEGSFHATDKPAFKSTITTTLPFTSAGLNLVLGSDAVGDTYYRNTSGNFERLPIGANGNSLVVSSGLPAWSADLIGSTITLSGTGLPMTMTRNSSVAGNAPTARFLRTGTTLTTNISSGAQLFAIEVQGRAGGINAAFGKLSYTATTSTAGDGKFNFMKANGTTSVLDIDNNTGKVNYPLATASTLLKVDASKDIISAVAGTDYLAPTALAAYAPLASPTFTGTVNFPASYTFSGYSAKRQYDTNLLGWGSSDNVGRAFLIRGSAPTDGQVLTHDSSLDGGNGAAKWATKEITVFATVDFTNVLMNQNATLTLAVTGAVVGDVVTLGLPNSILSTMTGYNGTFQAWVSATDVVSLRFQNSDPMGAHDLPSGTFKIKILK